MICKHCGMKQPDDVKTCRYCGRKLERSKKKTVFLCVLGALLVLELAFAAWIGVNRSKNQKVYDQALEFLSQEDYDRAEALLSELGNFRDARKLHTDLVTWKREYGWAQDLMAQEDYVQAARYWEGLGTYRDADARKNQCYVTLALQAARAGDTEDLEAYREKLDEAGLKMLKEGLDAIEEQNQQQLLHKEQAEELLKKAEEMAAGYDYRGAVELLNGFEFREDFPEFAEKMGAYADLDETLVSWPRMDQVTHVFFHSLIYDPARSFDGESTDAGYNQYMTTCAEFWAMMESMHEKGFVLVSPYDVAYEVTDEAGTRFVYGEIRLPAGKKPFIMSQDDLNYYGYMVGGKSGVNETPVFPNARGDGFAYRLVIGDDGYPTCEYMDKSGNVTRGDYDLVPLLEKFIREHPDFSYHGARAVLGVTGYEGVFGYRTKPSYEKALGAERYAQEVADAKAVAQCLREHGWILASHSYGHPAYGNISAQRVGADSEKWENTVQPIIGESDIILYPHGSDIAGGEKYTMSNGKFKELYQDGYRYFFNVDSSVYWSQLGENYYRGGRRNLDGYRMFFQPEKLKDLFDVSRIFDPARPTPVPPI